MQRRTFLQKLIQLAIGGFAIFLPPKPAIAAWPKEHFASDEFDKLIAQIYGNQEIVDSNELQIQLPEIAENGAVVPITISSELKQISKIHIWVEKNPTPLAAEFELSEEISAYLAARIKMAESCHVIVIAQQDGRLLRRRQWVKVMQGGCGTG